MKKTSLKTIVMIAIMVIAVLAMTVTAYAADNYKGTITTSTSWKTLATSTSGFNRNVTVFNSSATLDGLGPIRADIRMLGRNGNVVWQENKACPGYGERTFWCGSDVYEIQIKLANGYGTARAYPG